MQRYQTFIGWCRTFSFMTLNDFLLCLSLTCNAGEITLQHINDFKWNNKWVIFILFHILDDPHFLFCTLTFLAYHKDITKEVLNFMHYWLYPHLHKGWITEINAYIYWTKIWCYSFLAELTFHTKLILQQWHVISNKMYYWNWDKYKTIFSMVDWCCNIHLQNDNYFCWHHFSHNSTWYVPILLMILAKQKAKFAEYTMKEKV